MNQRSPHRILSLVLAVIGVHAVLRAQETPDAEPRPPHVVLILADDLGWGDVRALAPDSELPTPNLDRLAREGMTFSDAHSPSAVCTPTRYGLLTGRYAWRGKLQRGVLGGYSPALIEPNRLTIASVLRAQGYRTAAVGKWHLGMGLPLQREDANTGAWTGDPGIDFGGVITDGPTTRGFDTYFGVTGSLDMPPYVFVRNDHFVALPKLTQQHLPFPRFIREGPRSADFVVEAALDDLTSEAVGTIKMAAARQDRLLLYFPLTAPHKPTWPHPRFAGKTELGPYGDLVMQVDATVGRVLDALDETGLAGETLVVVTSDNGSYMRALPSDAEADHVDDASKQAYRVDRHRANGPFRGTKADVWEAGHRVPMLVRWPDQVAANSRCDATVCLTDWMATLAAITGATLPRDAGEDSASLVGLLRGTATARGAPVIHHSAAGMFAIRDGRWKLVLGNGSGGRAQPKGKPFGQPYALFDLQADPSETEDLADRHPDVVRDLTTAFERMRKAGRSVER